MPFPRRLARFNRRVTNPVARTLAGRTRPFDVVVHHGRRSGREYRTPVSAFPHEAGYVIALTYGLETEWLKNVIAEGGCELIRRRATHQLIDPRIVATVDQPAPLPALVTRSLQQLRVTDCLVMTESTQTRTSAP